VPTAIGSNLLLSAQARLTVRMMSHLQATSFQLPFWERIEHYANPALAAAYIINFVLAGIVFFLLRYTGRYRQTLFAKAFRSSPLSITISTVAEGRYLDVNHAFLQMLGYERRDIIGRTAGELGIWADPAERLRLIDHLGGVSTTSNGVNARLFECTVENIKVRVPIFRREGRKALLGDLRVVCSEMEFSEIACAPFRE
jgi:PAS domain-containing protein